MLIKFICIIIDKKRDQVMFKCTFGYFPKFL